MTTIKSSLPLSKIETEAYKELPPETAFADFETAGLGGYFIAGGLVDMTSNEVTFFRSIDEFFDLIFSGEKRVTEMNDDDEPVQFVTYKKNRYKSIYFHNLEYDGRYIIAELLKRKIKFEIINRCQRLMIIKIGRFSFVDSYALLMDSLKNLSNVFTPEYAKKTLDLGAVQFDFDNPVHLEYLIYDCLALKHVVIRCRKLIYETFNINAKFTTSSTALRAWLTTLDFDLFRLGKEKEEFVRMAYSGGLVYQRDIDVYENITVLDFNSMYPSVMRENRYPHGQSYFTDTFKGQGFYHVLVDSSKSKLQFITGYKNNKKIPRCKGIFEAFITDVEYRLGIELGYVFHVKRGLVFEQSDYLFKTFVNRCEELRLKHGKDSVGTIVKYIQNSLYGKFGTKETREKIFYSPEIEQGRTPFVDAETGEFNGLYIDVVDTDEPYMLPHLAAYTTALARCKLVRCMMDAGFNNVVYGDTDSVFVTPEGLANLQKIPNLFGIKYGMLKEENYLPYVLIIAPKLYFGSKKRAKGFPARVVRELEAALLDNKLEVVGKEKGGKNRYRVTSEFDGLNSCRAILKTGKPFDKKMKRSIAPLPTDVLLKMKELTCT